MNADNAKLFNAKYEQEELNEFLLRILMDKMGEKHNLQNSCSAEKKRPDKNKSFDVESFHISKTTHSKSTNSSDSGEPTTKKTL